MDNTNKSESIIKLAEALSKAQGQIKGAIKDASNPFFKSDYSTLHAVWEACRKPLSDNGLAVVQLPTESADFVCLETILMHSSGEWISGKIQMKPVKNDPQSIGSCLTYARRYALSAIVGIAPLEDDDGEGAVGRQKEAIKEKKLPDKPKQDFDFLKQVGEAKKQLKALFGNDNKYYEALVRFEYMHANEIPKEKQGEVLDELRKEYKLKNEQVKKEGEVK